MHPWEDGGRRQQRRGAAVTAEGLPVSKAAEDRGQTKRCLDRGLEDERCPRAPRTQEGCQLDRLKDLCFEAVLPLPLAESSFSA